MKASYRFFSILTAVLLSGFGLVCTGQNDALAQTTSVKTLNGEVSGTTNDSIAVVSKEDTGTGQELEILFAVDGTADLVGREKLREIQAGDIVSVIYEETVSTDESGNEMKERKVTTVKFLRAAPVAEEEPEADESDQSLTSEQQ